MKKISRRRFISLSATAIGTCLLSQPALARRDQKYVWRGIALGANAELTLYHNDVRVAEQAMEACVKEINRLEKMFSLFRRDSLLVQLNKDGKLAQAPHEMTDLFRLALQISKDTNGAFDISVQPLWVLYSRHFAQINPSLLGPDKEEVESVLKHVGWQNIILDDSDIILDKPNMALTLNGIAQGFITDKIVSLLTDLGFNNFLANMGEFRGVGQHSSGAPWSLGLPNGSSIELGDKAVATSSTKGTVFSQDGKFNHILDPRTGIPVPCQKSISVLSGSATVSDALSTAICTMDKIERGNLTKRYQNVEVFDL